METSKLSCIVHYNIKDAKYSKIKGISEINKDRIYEAKLLREKIRGQNHHEVQCSSIPINIDHSRHGIHLEPCYKKFTLILSTESKEKAHNSSSKNQILQRKSNRLSSPPPKSTRNLFPKECYFCKKDRVKYKQEIRFPIDLTTEQASNTIKETAENLEDKSIYYELKDLDLIAKEFRYHQHCYKDFTRKKTEYPSKGKSQNKGDYNKVKEIIEKNILIHNQAVSMVNIHNAYSLNPDDTRYRSKLKDRIQNDYKDKLLFIKVNNNTSEIVINSQALDLHLTLNDNEVILKEAANILRGDIIDYINSMKELPWPPTAKDLPDNNDLPKNVINFLENLLRTPDQPVTEKLKVIINSFASDYVAAVGAGKITTSKHFLVALGLHNLTGQKKVVQILNKLGHCLNYDLTCEIETSQAKLSVERQSNSSVLPLIPKDDSTYVLTYFWVDNFDKLIESMKGGGSVHSTHLVAFQEPSLLSVENQSVISISRDKSRKLTLKQNPKKSINVNPKKEPSHIITKLLPATPNSSIEIFKQKILIWLISRHLNEADQTIPTLNGWLLNIRKLKVNEIIQKTLVTYLPPIPAKVTEFETIHQYLSYLQELSSAANMKYVNVTLDIGAAINCYKLIWNYQDQFSNVIVHLGDFHFMKENFLIMGTLVTGSGFEDIAFQAGICTSGSINSVLSGSHYNRAWVVHATFSEALERILFKRFLEETSVSIPSSIKLSTYDSLNFNEALLNDNISIFNEYKDYKDKIRQGLLGKTPQFWLIYLDLMQHQHFAHTSVQENNYYERLYCWDYFLKFYFALNKTNYARYGSFYSNVLHNIDTIYPGLLITLIEKGLSVQAQDKYPLRTSIDQRGEQTLNKDAKSGSGIKNFANDEASVLKWTLNRPMQAENTKALTDLCGLNVEKSLYKPLRPSQVVRSEAQVQAVIKILQEEYVNPFDKSLDKSSLYHLSSGIPVPIEVQNNILNVPVLGMKLMTQFREERLHTSIVKFHEPIKKTKLKLFRDLGKKITLTKNNKTKLVEVNRNVLGTLIACSLKHEKLLDFEKVLSYPLAPVPLCLANPDGTRRITTKSNLNKIIMESCNFSLPQPPCETVQCFIVDMVAVIRCMNDIPDTYENLTWNFLKMLPKGYSRVDIVADSYFSNSIKNNERNKRGNSKRVIVASNKSKIPRDFQAFLLNGENKTSLIKLIFETIKSNVAQTLNILRCNELILANENNCLKISLSSCTVLEDYISNHEEADTKMILHASKVLQELPDNKNIVIRSHSGDVDVNVLAISLFQEKQQQIFIDFGKGASRKGIWLSEIKLDDEERSSLLGLHAFSGNDYISSFFRKSKIQCWKVMKSSDKFKMLFKELGNAWTVNDEIVNGLEEYVCKLYGYEDKSVNNVRYKMFHKKYLKENKIIDLSLIPPCKDSLTRHILRANTIASIWKKSVVSNIEFPDFATCGWLSSGDIDWIGESFPDDAIDLLADDVDDLDEIFGSDEETDEDENDI